MNVILFFLLSACGGPDQAATPEPAAPVDEPVPTEMAANEDAKAGWWAEESPCPDGSSLKGSPGEKVWCEDEEGEHQGRHTEWGKHGKRLVHYKEGQPHGPVKQWDTFDQLLGDFELEAGNGTWTDWHTNGEVKMTGPLVDGVRDGTWKVFDKEGELVEEIRYENGEAVH